jgi:hypothetical protein
MPRVRFGIPGDHPAELAATGIKVWFTRDQRPDSAGRQSRRHDCDRSAHTVPKEIDLLQFQCVQEANDGSGMVSNGVREIDRAIAFARSQ